MRMEEKMNDSSILNGKRILIVDDEKDVRETVSELLDMCDQDVAGDFDAAKKLLEEKPYDLAILDIMGVGGYDLLALSQKKGIPTIMFTAHALNPEAFKKSMAGGAKAYIPKEKMTDIASYAADLLQAHAKGIDHPGNWFKRLESFFERQFGTGWLEEYKKAREKYPWLDFDD
jgi:DNA-binding NtrC family response regulator